MDLVERDAALQCAAPVPGRRGDARAGRARRRRSRHRQDQPAAHFAGDAARRVVVGRLRRAADAASAGAAARHRARRRARVSRAALAEPARRAVRSGADELRAAAEPVLLVIEDAHWADDATLDLMKFLGRRIERARALLVVWFRDDEVPRRIRCAACSANCRQPRSRASTLPRLTPSGGRAARAARAAPPLGHARGDAGQSVLRHRAAARPGRSPCRAACRTSCSHAMRVCPPRRRRSCGWHRWCRRASNAGWSSAARRRGRRPRSLPRLGLLVAEGASLAFRHELARVAIESSLRAPVAQALHARVLRRAGAARPVSRRRASCTTPRAPATRRRCCATRRWPRSRRAAAAPTARPRRTGAPRSATASPVDEPQRATGSMPTRASASSPTSSTRPSRHAGARRAARTRGATLREARQPQPARDGARARAAQRRRRRRQPARDRAARAAAAVRRARLRLLARRRSCACSTATAHASVDWARKRDRAGRGVGAARRDLAVGAQHPGHGDDVHRLRRRLRAAERVFELALADGRHLSPPTRCQPRLGFGRVAAASPRRERGWNAASRSRPSTRSTSSCHYATAWLAIVRAASRALGRGGDARDRGAGARRAVHAPPRLMALVALGRLRLRRGDPGVQQALDEALALAEAQRHAAAHRAGARGARRGGAGCAATGRCATPRRAPRCRWRSATARGVRRRAGVLAQARRRSRPPAAGLRRAVRAQVEGRWARSGRGRGRPSAAPTSRHARWPTATPQRASRRWRSSRRLGARPAAEAVRRQLRAGRRARAWRAARAPRRAGTRTA